MAIARPRRDRALAACSAYFVPARAARHKLLSRGALGGENAMLKRRAVDGDGEPCLAESASLGGGSLSERRALNPAKTRRPESEEAKGT